MALNLGDIQGNLLRGYRFDDARHFALGIGDDADGPAAARRFLGDLICGDEARSPQITTDDHWTDKPGYCLNIGLTWVGLKTLGLPSGTLDAFPTAFREGPAKRAGDPDPASRNSSAGFYDEFCIVWAIRRFKSHSGTVNSS